MIQTRSAQRVAQKALVWAASGRPVRCVGKRSLAALASLALPVPLVPLAAALLR